MDWFRWHHGSVTDPKFQLIARKSGKTLPEVLAVWAFLLEQASAAEIRGSFGSVDCEAVDCLFSFEDGCTASIMEQMEARGLLSGDRVANWDKRQPKREDNTAAERKRRQREREQEIRLSQAQCDVTEGVSRNVTQRHAEVTLGHDRGEERREEEKGSTSGNELPPCPLDGIVALYHQHLPELPAIRVMNDKRTKSIRSFWKWVLTSKRADGQRRATDADEALTWIGQYFQRASANDFLMGRNGRGWVADLDFLLSERGKVHVIERTVTA